jgi:hypothetical protein
MARRARVTGRARGLFGALAIARWAMAARRTIAARRSMGARRAIMGLGVGMGWALPITGAIMGPV